jgi:adenylate kinase
MISMEDTMQQDGQSEIIYLTGAPATGKTSTAAELAAAFDVELFSYGQELTRRLQGRVMNQTELRAASANVITVDDVTATDTRLVGLVEECKTANKSLIIDSHAVTIESYGFRVIPYSVRQIFKYGFTRIVCLYASADILARRIQEDPGGRPLPSFSQLEQHNTLQASLALNYSHTTGAPLAMIDSARGRLDVRDAIAQFSHLKAAARG